MSRSSFSLTAEFRNDLHARDRRHQKGLLPFNCKRDWNLSFVPRFVISNFADAGVAELADALDSKSSGRKVVWVRAPPPAMNSQLILGVGRNHLSQLFAAFIWKKTPPDRFVGMTGFAFRIPVSHGF